MTVWYPDFEGVVAYHHQVMLNSGAAAILAAPDKLESALFRPQAEAFGEEAYSSLAEKAVVLLQGIVIAHPFMDGNKRAGLGVMLSFLEQNTVPLPDIDDQLSDFVLQVTTGELREVVDMAARLRELFTPHLG